MQRDSFIAVDFETANPKRVSACSLGFVKVIDGDVVEERSFLIKPVGSFSRLNIKVHGIQPWQTKDAPTFDQLFPELKSDFETYPVLSYSKFDESVFRSLIDYYRIPLAHDIGFVDVYSLARHSLLGLQNYKLPTVANCLQLPFQTHHDAKCDASQCAKVFLRLQELGMAENVKSEITSIVGNDWRRELECLLDGVLADDTIDLQEACLLQSFFSSIADKGQVFSDIAEAVHSILEDGVVEKQESDVLVALLRYVAEELCLGTRELSIIPSGENRRRTIQVNTVAIEVPDDFVPACPVVPVKYEERWDFVREHPFMTLASANVVITGNGVKISRANAEALVKRLGGNLKSSMVRDVDFCVVLGMSPEDCITGKASKPRQLQAQGSPVRILSEDDFLKMVRFQLSSGQ